jgi:D-alanine transaminase
MAKTQAVKEGYDDAWLVRDGFVTEGTSNNAFIITKQGVVVTRPLSQDILHGITRASVLQCVSETGLKLEERAFSVQEAENAAEAFVTSASGFVMPVVEINKKLLSDGQPGSFSLQLREIYIKRSLASAI